MWGNAGQSLYGWTAWLRAADLKRSTRDADAAVPFDVPRRT